MQIRYVVRSDRANHFTQLVGRVNSDTGSNYSAHRLTATGSVIASNGFSNQDRFYTAQATAATSDANAFGVGVMDFLDFSSVSKNTVLRTLGGYVGGNNQQLQLSSGAHLNTSAMTSFQLFDGYAQNFVAGSRFSLIGIR